MLAVSPKHRVFLAVDPIDFRKGIQGISSFCKHTLRRDPMTGHYFIFRNKRKTAIKILFYDAQGFCLFQKRLSSGTFKNWPETAHDLMTLTPTQLHVLIQNGNPQAIDSGPQWHPIRND